MKLFAAVGHAWIASCVLIAGCATPLPTPTDREFDACDCGEKPINYEAAIRRYFDDTLKDPASIQYREITEPARGYFQVFNRITGTQRHWGWKVDVTINARNSYGGYVGFKTYSFLFRGESLVDTMPPTSE